MYNKVFLVGNLTRDVELRYLPNGSALATIGLATNRKYKSQQGEQKEEVCFVDVTLFGRTAEIANQYLKKGSKILVEGRLVLEQWIDDSQKKRSKLKVVAQNMQMMGNKDAPSHENQNYTPQQEDNMVEISEDEIPF